MSGADNEDLLTIPEAAARIGVSERTLYRLLKSDNFAAKTLTQHRQTVTGRRLTTLLPPDLVREIAQAQPPPIPPEAVEAEGTRAGTGDGDTGGSSNGVNGAANGDENTGGTVPDAANGDNDSVHGNVPAEDDAEPGRLPAVVYQARIADLEAMNAELRADKERLYRLLEMAQGNLAREQALRSLPAPAPQSPVDHAPPGRSSAEAAPDAGQASVPETSPEAAETAPGDTQRPATGIPGTVTPPEAAQGSTEGRKAAGSWWERLLGRKE